MSDDILKDTDISKAVKNTYDALQTPDSWKQEILLKMQEEAMKEETPTVNEKKSHKIQFMAGLATLCAAALCLFLILPKGTPYVTSIEEGIYYNDIELKNGEIHFVSNRMAISITPNAGNAFSTTEEAQENPTEVLLCESGGMISFEKTQKSKLPEIAESNWSYIEEQLIYVTVLKTEPVRYQAIYEKDGETYELIGEGVTQKEFIDELYKRVIQ